MKRRTVFATYSPRSVCGLFAASWRDRCPSDAIRDAGTGRTAGPRHSSRDGKTRGGFTLIEVLVATGLVSLLMSALYVAMTAYFRLRTDSHDEIEQLQIARTLLRQISRDVQSVVFEETQPATPVEAETSGDSGSSTETSESSGADPSEAMSLYTNGIVGTETDLLLYVSRPDRHLSYVSAQSLTSVSDRTGDLMVIRYFVAETGSGGLASDIAERAGSGDRAAAGLVRMTGDLYGLSMAVQEGEDELQIAAANIHAREVSQIRFQYFDGSAWQPEWDSTELGMLPGAIEVLLTIQVLPDAGENDDSAADSSSAPDATTYRMVVRLPLADPLLAESDL